MRGRVENLSAAHPTELGPRGACAFKRYKFLTMMRLYLKCHQNKTASQCGIYISKIGEKITGIILKKCEILDQKATSFCQ